MMLRFGLALMAAVSACTAAVAAVGDTQVMKWENGAKACFLLMFDDGWPSAHQVAMPELAKRGLSATYYIVPEKGEYKAQEKIWKAHANDKGVVLGNHTMHHNKVTDYEQAMHEIGDVNTYIRSIVTNPPPPKLISWAQPGLKPGCWTISKEDMDRVLKACNLVSRPTFDGHGAVYHLQTCEQMMKLVDKALAEGGMEYVIFHGLEHKAPWRTWQDFWAMKQDVCFPFFDNLSELQKKGELWVTDHISYHWYETEFKTAKAKGARGEKNAIVVKLTTEADPEFYDYPLTLEKEVPAKWRKATVRQGAETVTCDVKAGKVRYRAVPGKNSIFIKEAK